MNIKKHTYSLVAAGGGLLIALAIIAATYKNDTSSTSYKVNIDELRALQSQLAKARIDLEELKINILTADVVVNPEKLSTRTEEIVPQSGIATPKKQLQVQSTNDVNETREETEVVSSDPGNDNMASTDNWRRIGEDEIAAAFHEINPMDSHLLTTACQPDTCQVEIAHNDKTAELQFLASVSESEFIFGYEGYFKNIENEDGSSKSVFYFSRDPQTTRQ